MIGVLGGTFDPVHCGHLAAARAVRDRLRLDSVRLMLSARPSHREDPETPVQHRMAMLRIACAAFPGLEPDDQEVRRQGPSYTVVTLEQLRTRHPGTRFCWILGSDAFLGLPTWHQWQRVFELAHLVVCLRVGYQLRPGPELAAAVAGRWCEELPDWPAGAVLPLALPLPAISASEVRARLREGIPASHLLPPGVSPYIEKHGLYRQLGSAGVLSPTE